MTAAAKMPLVLASQSKARYHMLRSAGLDFAVQDPDLDEAALQARLRNAMTPADVMAQALAHAKALSIAMRRPDALVIGADQILFCNGKIFSKPDDMQGAKAHLRYLGGKTHHLISAVCLAQKDKVIWSHAERAKLTMRTLDDDSIDRYCDRAGDGILRSVGAYELEGFGAWLFDRIEGDYYTILGLPLLPLLHMLRDKGYGL